MPLTVVWVGGSFITLLTGISSGKVGPIGAAQRIGYVFFMSVAQVPISLISPFLHPEENIHADTVIPLHHVCASLPQGERNICNRTMRVHPEINAESVRVSRRHELVCCALSCFESEFGVVQVVGSLSRMGLSLMTFVPPNRTGYFSDSVTLAQAVQRPANAFEAFGRCWEELFDSFLAAFVGILLDPTQANPPLSHPLTLQHQSHDRIACTSARFPTVIL